jgi:hypothetical protein
VIPQFLVAGTLALAAAAIHGGVGEVIVVRRLPLDQLPSTRFGGPPASMVMLRFSWHAVTLTFAVLGVALVTCGFLGPGNGCRGIGIVAASTFTAFVLLTPAVLLHRPRTFIRHPGPLAFLAVAALAWWGSL